jgi:hypothetical protein
MFSTARIQTLRTCWQIATLALCALLWVALLTFDPYDWPSTAAWPPNDPVFNGCGRAGALLAFILFKYLGKGAYPLALFVTIAAVIKLARGGISDPVFRLIGVSLLVIVTADSVAIL